MRLLLITLVLTLFYSPVAQAETRYGLVLSGGAARGLAHIGVLKALEEQGIRPVAIAGTSMGGLIGGFYAAGYNAEQIEDIARTMDWRDVFVDFSKRSQRPYELRQIDADLMVSYKLTFSDGQLSTPRGIIQGQRLQLELERILSKAPAVENFEQLPVPFRTVATDLSSGQQVILADGSLAHALRATMSIPGLLEPVLHQGTLLVDGGISNNMPVDVARRMAGVDKIIAVDVGTPLMNARDIRSLGGVIGQYVALTVRNNVLEQIRQLQDGDILIQPQLGDMLSTEFDKLDDSIEQGYQPTLRALQNSESSWSVVPPPPPSTPESARIIRRIKIDNDTVLDDNLIRHQIRQPLDQPLNLAALREDIDTLYALDFFSSMRYQLDGEPEDSTLLIIGKPREWGVSWVRLGLEATDNFRGESTFDLHASGFLSGFSPRGAHWYGRASLGSEPGLYSHYYQPLDSRLRWYLKPNLAIQSQRIEEIDWSVDDKPYARSQQVERELGLTAGRHFWRQKGSVFAGVVVGEGQIRRRIGSPLRLGEYDYGYYQLGLGVDTLDDLSFPTRGFAINYRYLFHRQALGSQQDHGRSIGNASFVTSNRRVSWILEGAWSRTFNTAPGDLVRQEHLGGFLELSGLPQGSLSGQQRVLGRAIVQVRLKKNPVLPISMPVYLGLSAERGLVFDDSSALSWDNSIESGSIFLGVATFLGPVYLAYGRTEGNHQAVNFSLGRRFR